MTRFQHIFKALAALVATGLMAQIAWASAPSGRYQYGSCAATSIYDHKTKLMWQAKPAENPDGNWSSSVDYCKTVRADNFTWRTPTVKELSTLIDYTEFADGGQSVAVDRRFTLASTVIWTGTPDPTGTLTLPASGGEPVPSAFTVDFASGQVTLQTMNQKIGVWCVSDASPLDCS